MNNQLIAEALGNPKSSWWCPRCGLITDGSKITNNETHDERYGGCGLDVFYAPDFSTSEGFFVIMEKGPKQEWWDDFWSYIYEKARGDYGKRTNGREMSPNYFWQTWLIPGFKPLKETYLNPLRMVDALEEFLKERSK
ncbi:MAG: hypothetical protein WC648_05345 [Candidatus Paceibacterota bacterium]|jgi:hypothetical protein